LSTLTLLEANSELSALRKICSNDDYLIEANDMTAVQLMSGKKSFATGPAVNIYNSRTLEVLAKSGLKRWVLPVELSKETLTVMHQGRPLGVETEVLFLAVCRWRTRQDVLPHVHITCRRMIASIAVSIILMA